MTLLILGFGYTAGRTAPLLAGGGPWLGTTRDGRDGTLAFDDAPAVERAIASATRILSSIPPGEDGRDSVLDRYGPAIAASRAEWIGYLSSTGVYGDMGGAWVDEGSPVGTGRRAARTVADRAWAALDPPGDSRVRVFRLPGIYGPGRSVLDRLRDGRARRFDAPAHAFSRIHVDDIAGALVASLAAPAGTFNIADDQPCPPAEVTAFGAALLGVEPPPLEPLDLASMSPMAAGFWSESRRVANGRAQRVLGWRPRYPDYRAGLLAVRAEEVEAPPPLPAQAEPVEARVARGGAPRLFGSEPGGTRPSTGSG